MTAYGWLWVTVVVAIVAAPGFVTAHWDGAPFAVKAASIAGLSWAHSRII